VPVPVWALLTYVGLATLLVVRARGTALTRERATVLVLALAVWSLVFSLYMAAIAALIVRAVCLLCSALYVLNALIALLAWRLARATGAGATPLMTRSRVTVGAAAMAVALGVVGGSQLAGGSAGPAHLTPEDVQARNPDFYAWYAGLPVVEALPPAEHARGRDDAPITIVEFSDFECAYCAKAFRDLRDVERQHGGTVRIVFHHFPLDPTCNPHVPTLVHRSACDAAIAAECAARFGRFWDFHDRLFENQRRLGRDYFIGSAVDLGIDRGAFAACLDDGSVRDRIAADAAAGARLGVKSTPTLFVNGRTVEGALDRTAYDWVLAMEHHG